MTWMSVCFSDVNVPFSRWDQDRIVSWFNEMGLNMYLAEVRRWVRNGDQLLKASQHDIEKVQKLLPYIVTSETFMQYSKVRL